MNLLNILRCFLSGANVVILVSQYLPPRHHLGTTSIFLGSLSAIKDDHLFNDNKQLKCITVGIFHRPRDYMFFANNSLTEYLITMEFLRNLF